MVDIKLRQWAEQALPAKSVESGWEALQNQFNELIQTAKKNADHDDIFDQLKANVVEDSIKRHTWEDKVRFVNEIANLHHLTLYFKLGY